MDLTTEEKRRMYSILTNMTVLTPEDRKRKTNNTILLVDGTNTFIRTFMANPSMDVNGNHSGGLVGFLKSVGYAIKLLRPSRCVIIFDGIGGSFKRRQLYPEYKSNRRGRIRLNRTYEDNSDITTEEESCRRQYIRLSYYLKVLPVNLLSIDHVEADDVIAYLALQYFKDSKKVYIMSSDKDFLQLCSDNVNVYSPTKKLIYGPAEVLKEYQIHPNNFVLFRSLDGDDSDNIDGIKGAGLKTIIKHFPWLNEDKLHTVDDIISHAEPLKDKYKVCENIVNNKTILDRNVELMQLKETYLTTIAQLHCNECLDTSKIQKLDRGAFYKLVREDMLGDNLPNHIQWLDECWNGLDSVVRSE